MEIKEDLYNFDLKKMVLLIRNHKKQYGIILLVSLVFGIVVSFSIPKSYTTKIMLAPETSTEGALGGSLSSLTSLVGLNMNGMSSDAIFPEIYPDVVRSTSFLVELSTIRVQSADKSISTTLFDYFDNKQKSPWWIEMFSFLGKKETNKHLNAFMLDKEQSGVIKDISNSITCNVNKDNGVITIKATAQDPLISAVLADSVSVRLQEFITSYRTNKARNDLNNIQKLYVEAKARYDKARQLYSSYADANQDLVLEAFKAKESDLENEMQLQYNIYSQVTAQLQMARAKVIEKTPVYAVLQPATVPYRHSAPKKSLVILAFLFLGSFGYTAYLMFKH